VEDLLEQAIQKPVHGPHKKLAAILTRQEVFAFAVARCRVQSLAYESDTSIDDHGV